MLTIKCSRCKSKIFKYQKIGKGKIITCWNSRIHKDYGQREKGQVLCACGNIIGAEIVRGVRMKHGNFTYSGSRSSK